MPENLWVQQSEPGTPMLRWDATPGAARYEVRVAGGSPVTTVDTTYVPTTIFPSGTQQWQVLAVNTAGEKSSWAVSSFTAPAVGRPAPKSPANGEVLEQPADPPLLTWTTVAGADSYEVEVDGDSDLHGASKYTTKNPSLVVPNLLGAGDWFWRVTAMKGGSNFVPSQVVRFDITSIANPRLLSPIDNASVQDVVLDWEPVPGAKSYDVQVAPNASFTGTEVKTYPRVLGTRYSPDVSFDNADYDWRVRAVDVAGNAPDWGTSSHQSFTRTYPFAPELVHPADGDTIGNPVFLQWEPVRHASEYELLLGTTSGFAPGTYAACRIAGTIYTPGIFSLNVVNGSASRNNEHERCRLASGRVNY